MDLRAEKKSLRRLLGMEDEQFRIPPYQRPYSWTSEQVDDLWDRLCAERAQERQAEQADAQHG